MKITIHQPEHFPYLGFYQKMMSADLFVILDSVKFRKNYFQNRNRFLNSTGEEEWFTVPVPKNSSSMLIKDIRVCDDSWRGKIVRKMQLNFGLDLSSVYDSDMLIDINMNAINRVRDALGISVPMVKSSDINVSGSKTELLLDICKTLNASEYISGPSGKDYLEMNKFYDVGIGVSFFEPDVDNYYSVIK